MAGDYDISSGMNPPDHGRNALTVGLAMVAGLGLTLMIGAGTVGVIKGEAADSNLVNLLFAGGTALLLSGIVAWALVKRPWETFDDIEVPIDSGHGHH